MAVEMSDRQRQVELKTDVKVSGHLLYFKDRTLILNKFQGKMKIFPLFTEKNKTLQVFHQAFVFFGCLYLLTSFIQTWKSSRVGRIRIARINLTTRPGFCPPHSLSLRLYIDSRY